MGSANSSISGANLTGATSVKLSGSTQTVGGDSYSETVDLSVNEVIGVPNNQKINDSNF